MITIDQVKDSAVRYLESHAVELGGYLVSAATLWIRDRRHTEAVIKRAHDEYVSTMYAIEERMRAPTTDGEEAT